MAYKANSTAPVALFVYNRPWHTEQTVTALKNNLLAADTKLFIFSDAPKNQQDTKIVFEVRRFIKSINGFKEVHVVERQQNFGLAKSIINGVSEIVNNFGRIIVMEDDLVTSPYFLQFMNTALEFYNDEEKVISIHGYTYPLECVLPDTFFLRGADCWGWATWKRGWDLFEVDGKKLLKKIKAQHLRKDFDIDGNYPFYRMLKQQVKGKNNSWAVRWHASAFLENRLTLYPGTSLVNNIGHDSSGTHCQSSHEFNTRLSNLPVPITKIPVEENQQILSALGKYFKKHKFNIRQTPLGFLVWVSICCVKSTLPSCIYDPMKDFIKGIIYRDKKCVNNNVWK